MATKEQKILKKILGGYYENNSEMLFSCPFCNHHKKKMSVNLDKNVWKCWVCDSSGRSIDFLVKKFGSTTDLKDWGLDQEQSFDNLEFILFGKKVEIKNEAVFLPEGFLPLFSPSRSYHRQKALKYMQKRGYNNDQIFKMKVGVCTKGEYKGRVIIPSFDEQGNLNYFIARTYSNDFPKYKNPKVSKSLMVFNELTVNFNHPVIIVEGVFDAMRIGNNAVPILGSTIKSDHLLFQRIVENKTPVYIALDEDAHKKEKKIIQLFLNYGIDVKKVDTTGYEDVATMPREIIEEKIKNATDMGGLNFLYQLIDEVA
jgi:DNA primase